MKCFLLCSKVILRAAFLFLIGLAALTPAARAGSLYARIHGTVTDSSGAVVPEVTVIAFNTGTGLVRTVSSDANGNFEFIQLPIGTYKVSASKDGFKRQESNGITLVLDQNYALPIQMDVGSMAETITVEANPVQVETTSNQLGSSFNNCKPAWWEPLIDSATPSLPTAVRPSRTVIRSTELTTTT
jgi:hypothetical protein